MDIILCNRFRSSPLYVVQRKLGTMKSFWEFTYSTFSLSLFLNIFNIVKVEVCWCNSPTAAAKFIGVFLMLILL